MNRFVVGFLLLSVVESLYATVDFQTGVTATPPRPERVLPNELASTANGPAPIGFKLSTQEEFSELAFGNANNFKDPVQKSNLDLSSQKDFGTVQKMDMPPYGANLFGVQCVHTPVMRSLNPDYRITVGDKINVVVWGAFQFNNQLTVDTQGNIFLPEVGPIHIQGIQSQQLNEVLQQHIKQVFFKDVNVYGDLVTAQPVQIFVSGYVQWPGLYDGLSSESVISFLCRAGGIDLKSGSFRDIVVLREGQVVQRVDLYAFLRSGHLDHTQLHQGDTVLVGPMRHVVTASGNVRGAYQFELKGPSITMPEFFQLAMPDDNVTHVRIERHQGEKPLVSYLPVKSTNTTMVKAGDNIVFISDQSQSKMVITVAGEVKGQHQFVLRQGENLDMLLNRVQTTDEADVKNVQLFRRSVAEQQKTAVESSLARLERQTLMNTPVTADGARMQGYQSQMLSRFIDKAKHIQFRGQVVLGAPQEWKMVRLENGDTINVPRKTNIVTVSGEVLNAISIEIDAHKTFLDYIHDAGGFTATADRSKVLLVHLNGKTETLAQSIFSRRRRVSGGDQLIVISKPQTENWQITQSLSQIMYQIAFAAKVALVA